MCSQQPHIRDYSPSLTVEQFTEACHHLDNIYTRADLGMLRRRWKLNVHNHFDLFGFQSYVSIKLPVRLPDQQTGDLADALEKFNWDDEAADSAEMSIDHDAEMADSENLWNSKSTGLTGIMTPKQPTVTYDIIWQPSYGTPRLWFTLNDLPEIYCATDHETVYHLLVPEEQKFIREMGVLGAISLEPHPITSKPAFFVHDCNTTEVLTSLAQQRGSKIPLQDYLIIWLGLVGHAVGLSVPVKMGLLVAEGYENSGLIGVSWNTDMDNLMQFSETGWIIGNKPANSLFKIPKTIVDPFAGTWGLKPSDLLLEKKVGLLTDEVTTSTRRFKIRSNSMCAAISGADRPGVMSRIVEGVDDGREVKRRRTGSVDRDIRLLWTVEGINAVDIDDYWTKKEECYKKQATGNTDLHSHPKITHSLESSPHSEIDEGILLHSLSSRSNYGSRKLGKEDLSASRIANSHHLIKQPNPLLSAGSGLANTQMRHIVTQSNPLLGYEPEFMNIPLDDDAEEDPENTVAGDVPISLRGGGMSNSSGSDHDSAPHDPTINREPTDAYVPVTPINNSGELHCENSDSDEIMGVPIAVNRLRIILLDKKRLFDLVDQQSSNKGMPTGDRWCLVRSLPGAGKRKLHKSFRVKSSSIDRIHSGENDCSLSAYEACYSVQTRHSIETCRATRTYEIYQSTRTHHPTEISHATKTYESRQSVQTYHSIKTCHHSDGTRCPSSNYKAYYSAQTHHSVENQIIEDKPHNQDLTLSEVCDSQVYLNQRTLKAHIQSGKRNLDLDIERWIQDVVQSLDSES